jgi:hypothetical protein
MTEARRSQGAVILGVITWVCVGQFASNALVGILAGLGVAIAIWMLTAPRGPAEKDRADR